MALSFEKCFALLKADVYKRQPNALILFNPVSVCV